MGFEGGQNYIGLFSWWVDCSSVPSSKTTFMTFSSFPIFLLHASPLKKCIYYMRKKIITLASKFFTCEVGLFQARAKELRYSCLSWTCISFSQANTRKNVPNQYILAASCKYVSPGICREQLPGSVRGSLSVRLVWPRPSLSANIIIGHFRMYYWRASALMRLCACVGWIWICAVCICSKTPFRFARPIYIYYTV